MRIPLIAGNWKMNTTLEEALNLVGEMKEKLENIKGVEKIICPPFPFLVPIKNLLENSSIKLGAQNIYFEDKGAYTGEVSPLMLRGLCKFVILGHSERRQYFAETDEVINKKLEASLKAELKPILCIGEKLKEKETNRTEEVVVRQLRLCLKGIRSLASLIIAYEPVWAIGTGIPASGNEANATIGLIRETLAEISGAKIAATVRILYGGSVTKDNISEFMIQEEIDGALVGGASLKASEFISIVEQTAAIKRKPH